MARNADLKTDRRLLSADERLGDALFTGLRLLDGIDIRVINSRYDTDVWERHGSELQPFVDAGILVIDGPRWRLTREGCLVAHEVMTVFV